MYIPNTEKIALKAIHNRFTRRFFWSDVYPILKAHLSLLTILRTLFVCVCACE